MRLGKYQLLRPLATGGMGEVFLAQQEGPGNFARVVVIKRIRPEYASNPQFVKMFLNEARLAGLLTHANVVQLIELGEEQGAYHLVMEYVHGQSLRAASRALYQRQERFPPAILARICADALRGLHYGHTLTDRRGELLNIVHRDVSPDNLLITYSGTTKVADFGIARAGVVSKTSSRVVRGKLPYMAPERIMAAAGDARSDVYSMGVVLYEMLGSALPFDLPDESELARSIMAAAPRSLTQSDPSIPGELEDIALRALAKEPEDRFASAAEMAARLDDFVGSRWKSTEPADVSAFMAHLFGADAPKLNLGVPTQSWETRSALPETMPFIPVPATPAAAALEKPRASRSATPWVAGVGGVGVVTLTLAIALGRGPGTRSPRAMQAKDAGMPSAVALATRVEPKADISTLAATLPVTAVPVLTPPPPPPSPSEPAANSTAQSRPVGPSRARVHHPRKASAPPPPSPAAAAAPTFGLVEFRVFPWAEVLIGDRSLGVTPMPPVLLPTGEHVLILRNIELEIEKRVPVNVVADSQTMVRINLAP